MAERPRDDGAYWDAWLSSQSLVALLAAHRVGLLAAAGAAPVDVTAFAERRRLDRRVLGTIVTLLVELGILAERDEGLVVSADADLDGTWAPMLDVIDHGNRLSADLCNALSGRTPTPVWTWPDVPADIARIHLEAMHAHSVRSARHLAETGLFDGTTSLLDVGGGSACYAVALSRRLPALRCDVLELPPFAPLVEEWVDAELRERVRVRALTFGRDSLDHSYEAVLFSNFLHDHDPSSVVGFLATGRSCLSPGGRVVVHEILPGDPEVDLRAAQFSVHMATWTMGRQYSRDEYREFLAAAALRLIDVVPVGALHSAIVAEPA
ncbi:MAG: methyltransferase [Frankiaceae bacterium]